LATKQEDSYMELLWSLGLIVVILLALNHMAGGRSSNVLRPVGGIIGGLISFTVRLSLSVVRVVLRCLGGSISGSLNFPPGKANRDTDRPAGPTPPRWDD
jgi:hypothetical protein